MQLSSPLYPPPPRRPPSFRHRLNPVTSPSTPAARPWCRHPRLLTSYPIPDPHSTSVFCSSQVKTCRTNRTARQIKMLTTRAKRAMAVAPRYGEDAGVDGTAVQNERQQTDPTASAKNAKTATKQAAPAPDDRDLDALVNDIENAIDVTPDRKSVVLHLWS